MDRPARQQWDFLHKLEAAISRPAAGLSQHPRRSDLSQCQKPGHHQRHLPGQFSDRSMDGNHRSGGSGISGCSQNQPQQAVLRPAHREHFNIGPCGSHRSQRTATAVFDIIEPCPRMGANGSASGRGGGWSPSQGEYMLQLKTKAELELFKLLLVSGANIIVPQRGAIYGKEETLLLVGELLNKANEELKKIEAEEKKKPKGKETE